MKTENPSLLFILYTDPTDPRDHAYEHASLFGSVRDLGIRPPLWPMMGGAWRFGEAPTKDLQAFLLAFLRFIEEPWVDGRMIRPDRPAMKRAIRAGRPTQEVRVVRLRRAEQRHRTETGECDVLWSHRWLVRGHWRRQWYPSLSDHRPRWIPGHIKGPEHLPLIVKDTVFRVDR